MRRMSTTLPVSRTSQFPTAICAHHRVRSGQAPVPPAKDLSLAANFLYNVAPKDGLTIGGTSGREITGGLSFTNLASGFSGADLANLVNEAALNAARNNRKSVLMYDFELAKDKVLMGVERRSLIISETEKKTIAYHEAGHALVAVLGLLASLLEGAGIGLFVPLLALMLDSIASTNMPAPLRAVICQ